MTTAGQSTGQRGYAAACPNCGAPVSFASAASASAVCSFCRSTLVRDGEALKRIGVSAELFDDHSPLQLSATGQLHGVAFTLVGRLQMAYEGGTWNEWHALFDNGRSAWLSEDNGAYVMAFDAPLPGDAPALTQLNAGQRCRADGRAWDVASVVRAKLLAAQGELPMAPRMEGEFTVADLRNAQGEVATLDGGDDNSGGATHWSVGRSVTLSELRMQGLREVGEKTLGSRTVECPSCGAALAPRLASTQSISCGQCRSVVDLSQGVGGDLAHYAQNNSGADGREPQIALGRTGQLELGGPRLPWTVVGYQERCDLPEAGSEDDEQTFWREYLLYNQREGFAFLVDAEDGWSWMKPLTGAPELRGDEALWQGRRFRRQYSYAATVTWVQGEFYWRVQRDERAQVMDFLANGKGSPAKLSREQTASEVTWSAGDGLQLAVVADAFNIPAGERAAMQRDATPLSSSLAPGDMAGAWGKIKMVFIALIIIVVLVSMLTECSDDRCGDERRTFGEGSPELQQCLARGGGTTRSTGGSYGGYSSGGGHK